MAFDLTSTDKWESFCTRFLNRKSIHRARQTKRASENRATARDSAPERCRRTAASTRTIQPRSYEGTGTKCRKDAQQAVLPVVPTHALGIRLVAEHDPANTCFAIRETEKWRA
ncbi:hypothetical protein CRV24_008652 [Beauveria bassiana]|nr:hypothetical protein CRV24_008652 [Beauveria bassiana]KAH8715402.1 hypothetical protein HC256_004228 [Beauveria bassiana]